MSLERIIRPGQGKTVGLAAPFHGTPTPPAEEPPNLECGSGGASLFDVKISAYNEVVSLKETNRVYDIVRVKNPQDESQFVDMELAKSVTHRRSDGSKQTTEYNADVAKELFLETIKRDLERSGTG